MAAKKKKATKKKPPHCKNVTVEKTGKKRKMCFGADGKITSQAKVAAYNKRRKASKARQAA